MKRQTVQTQTRPKELIASAVQRSADFVTKLKKAMKDIEDDIAKNDGLYPFNGGRISQAEVCRRADVKNTSLQGTRHKTTTKKMVDTWVKAIGVWVVTGKKSVRKTITGRADAWKEAHRKVALAHHIDQLKFESAQVRIRELEIENAALRAQLSVSSDGRVVGFPKRGQ